MSTENVRKKKHTSAQQGPDRSGGIFSAAKNIDTKNRGETDTDIESQVYKIMEDQLKAGTFGAQSMGTTGQGFGPASQTSNSDPASDFLSQWMTLYTQMLNMGMSMFESFADMREKQSDPIPFSTSNPVGSQSTQQQKPDSAPEPSPVKVNLICKQPAEVIVDLRIPASLSCRVQPLQNLEGKRGMIKNVKFELIDGAVALSLTIPKTSASGTYVGAIISEDNNTGCGTITVKL